MVDRRLLARTAIFVTGYVLIVRHLAGIIRRRSVDSGQQRRSTACRGGRPRQTDLRRRGLSRHAPDRDSPCPAASSTTGASKRAGATGLLTATASKDRNATLQGPSSDPRFRAMIGKLRRLNSVTLHVNRWRDQPVVGHREPDRVVACYRHRGWPCRNTVHRSGAQQRS